jgi:aryl-phospho-beta-D-glucosidase BglC (GH1 family)
MNTRMKKHFFIPTFWSILALMGVMLVSCGSESKEDPEVADPTFSTQNLTFSASEGSQNFSLKAAALPTVTVASGGSWCSVTEKSASANGTYQYTVSVLANPATEAREGSLTVTVKGNSKTFTVSVSQEAKAAEPEKDPEPSTPSGEVSPNSQEPDATGMTHTAIQIASDIYAGWNIGNTLEAINGSTPSETAWGNPKITEKLIQSIKSAGFNAVRLPCAWDGYVTDRSTYKISDTWLNRVDEVVGWCVNNGLYAIVNIHWDGGWLENNCTESKKAENLKEQYALWIQIADKLRNYDEHLLFAGCNEPNAEDEAKMAVLREYEQTFVDAVRATGGKNYYRTLIVQGPNTDIDNTYKYFGDMPKDVVEGRMMAEVHYYSPWNFCGMTKDESWGKYFCFWGEGNHIADSDRNANWGEEDYLLSQFQKMKTQFVDKGYPVILGEYGALSDFTNTLSTEAEKQAHRQSRYDFNMKVTREAKNHGMVPFMWDTGNGMDRNTGDIKADYVIPAIMEGAAAGKYPF